MNKYRFLSVFIIALIVFIGYSLWNGEEDGSSDFKYGLDLSGGTQLIYRADTSKVDSSSIDESMDVLRTTIEKRVNSFGVSEPIVQIEKGSSFSSEENQNRLLIELPGVTDIDEALKMIGETPLLEFKLVIENPEQTATNTATATEPIFVATGLTGGLLKRANVVFNQMGGVTGPVVTLEFNNEGSDLFAKITRENTGQLLAIFLDGEVISAPVIRQEIIGGVAQIEGNFTAEEARDLVNNLNFGALPLPIELIGTQTVGASLGSNTLENGVKALMISMAVVLVYMILFYRLPGLLAGVSLTFYLGTMLLIFKTIPVVLTAPGIAGFILTIGMAVDANVLIFERLKEELDKKLDLKDAIEQGFKRAWPSIRDGNLSSILAAVILYWFSGTSMIKGFALVFVLGVLVSMLSAVIVSRTLLLATSNVKLNKFGRFLYSKGLTNIKN
jgi:preprotein translocase subunit SecD